MFLVMMYLKAKYSCLVKENVVNIILGFYNHYRIYLEIFVA